jgi:leader peptidase (prepilin peptidase)/N-methyltransferase
VTIAYTVAFGLWLFAVGAVVGSFLNVCIYRIPWQKSVIWPASMCPKCLRPIAFYDNIPVLSWLELRGECRRCGQPIPARYALIEFLVGILFVAVFLVDVGIAPWQRLDRILFGRMLYHQALLAFLLVATFIDYDLQIIPDEVTVPGMVIGLLGGTLIPAIRPEPATAATMLGGLGVGLVGMAAGGGLTWTIRFVFSRVFRREAMGFGDVMLMAMIGAFLGWQMAVLAFFLSPFFGLGHAAWKLGRYLEKRLIGAQSSSADRELAFGPYLSMAATALVLTWPWLWPAWARGFFETLSVVFWFVVSGDLGPS